MPVLLSDAAIRYICTHLPALPCDAPAAQAALHAEVFAAMHRLNRKPKPADKDRESATVRSVVVDIGGEKIAAIKALRAATGCGLKEAKDTIEGTIPRVTRTFASLEEARDFIYAHSAAFEIAP